MKSTEELERENAELRDQVKALIGAVEKLAARPTYVHVPYPVRQVNPWWQGNWGPWLEVTCQNTIQQDASVHAQGLGAQYLAQNALLQQQNAVACQAAAVNWQQANTGLGNYGQGNGGQS